MSENKKYKFPVPIIDDREEKSLEELTKRYEKLVEPTKMAVLGEKAIEILPTKIKDMGSSLKNTISEQEIYIKALKIAVEGFKIIEEQSAKFTINEKAIIKKINKVECYNEITKFEEICLARSYDISKVVSKYKMQDIFAAFTEGGITGYAGFAGIPFNLVLSTFLYYRAVQSVAMFYGYDVKNDSAELVIAGQVFMKAISPQSNDVNEMSTMISKIMIFTESTAIKQTVSKSWADMASKGGIRLLITQMRALAHKSAQKALEKAGKKGLEKTIFSEVFEQIGKKLTKDAVGKGVPYFSAVLGALIDTAQMKQVLDYADIFYNKRYILEKGDKLAVINDGNYFFD